MRVLCNVLFPSKVTRPGFSSNAFPFQLVPTITEPTPAALFGQAGGLARDHGHACGRQPAERRRLYRRHGDRPASGTVGAPSSSRSVAAAVPATIAAGVYPLRVEVDGAQSLLTLDETQGSPTFGQWLPQVQVTTDVGMKDGPEASGANG